LYRLDSERKILSKIPEKKISDQKTVSIGKFSKSTDEGGSKEKSMTSVKFMKDDDSELPQTGRLNSARSSAY